MPTTPAEIASRLAWQMETWASIELRVREEEHNLNGGMHGKPYEGSIETHYIETAVGQRLFELLVHPPEGADQLFIYYADGERFADATYETGFGSAQQQVVIKRVFANEDVTGNTWRPPPLKWFYLEQVPLHDLLPEAVHVGSERHAGRDCDSFLLAGVNFTRYPVDLIYCLDRETGIPLHLRFYDDAATRREDRPRWTWEADSFDSVGDHYFPLKSNTVQYDSRVGTTDPPTTYMTKTITVEEIHFDREYPASTFWPVAQPGAVVWDQIQQKVWTIPTDGSDPEVQDVVTPTTTAEPVQAFPPRDWTPTVSAIGLGLGAAVVMVALLMRWRRV